ncbi:hypothetical protein L1987_31566 [Smallanthus sonchifolius]|uniref:Uncharacterized protein n=1 Tax=Smallanthus sonchifolius TaxID=185202 RepID=A0ACB9I5Z7_9ASTR|nr:hypothetical protein L1987_31566 [Smallanthus sonchifolius]
MSLRILCDTSTITPYTRFPAHRPSLLPPSSLRTSRQIVSAAKKLSRTGKFDSKNKRGSTSTGEEESSTDGAIGTVDATPEVQNFDGYVLPDLPGLEPDFWEGPQWDGFGFFIEYLWAFGIVFALISSGIAVATYNEGATDFKETPAYKESIQSRDLLEEPEASSPDVFESNPTEEAPSLE